MTIQNIPSSFVCIFVLFFSNVCVSKNGWWDMLMAISVKKSILLEKLSNNFILTVTNYFTYPEKENQYTSSGQEEKQKVRQMFYHLQRLIPSLYGEIEQTYTSCFRTPCRSSRGTWSTYFTFEAMISHLKHQFHGTRGIVRQIVRNLLLAQNSGFFYKEGDWRARANQVLHWGVHHVQEREWCS